MCWMVLCVVWLRLVMLEECFSVICFILFWVLISMCSSILFLLL